VYFRIFVFNYIIFNKINIEILILYLFFYVSNFLDYIFIEGEGPHSCISPGPREPLIRP